MFASKMIMIAITLAFTGCQTIVRKVQSESFVIILLKDFYEGQGAVVPAKYPTFGTPNVNGRFTPTIDQIIDAEKILRDNLDFIPKKYTSDNLEESVKDLKKAWKTFNRYYIGYLNHDGQHVLNVYLFDYRSKEGKRIFSGWENDVVYSESAHCYYFNINLERRALES